RLEMLLARARDHASAAATEGDPVTAARWLRRAEILSEASVTLQRTAPNRQLLLDSLMLRLAKA
ncbi:MAG TPA: hypothetical protein VEB21_21560, partial [Terriglobales bacterium]|nr:hypothetical protein [Terriglobales bacterium]